jgi:hypothetical protein
LQLGLGEGDGEGEGKVEDESEDEGEEVGTLELEETVLWELLWLPYVVDVRSIEGCGV